MKIGICVIATERNNYTWDFIKSLIDLRMHLKDDGYLIHINFGGINQARDLAMRMAKEKRLDYLCFIDSDMTFPHNGINEIIKTMNVFEAQIGCGLYFTGNSPYHPVAYELDNENYIPIKDFSSARQIGACGMGFTVISKEAFDISFEWGKVNKNDVGEDIAFCDRAKEKGYKVILNPSVKCGHLRMIQVNEDYIKKINS